jgi:hypothetical protein
MVLLPLREVDFLVERAAARGRAVFAEDFFAVVDFLDDAFRDIGGLDLVDLRAAVFLAI